MKILIVEDELLIAEMLKEMLIDLGHDVIAIAKNVSSAQAELDKRNEIDFCFLDINLRSDKSGLDIAAIINEKYFIPFAFLTSYSDKSKISEALEYKPEAYLVKPFSEIDLFTTLELIKGRTALSNLEKEPQSIIIKDGTKNVKLTVDDILWLKSDNIYVEIKTTTKTHLIRNSLTQFLEEMNALCIERVHRTFAVNINHVNAITGQHIVIKETNIPLSRKYREDILAKFQQ
jgi:two-component system, LytTR family, response regulator LytT